LTANATLSNGTVQNVTTQATWQSSSASAPVSPGGFVAASSAGEYDITATYQAVNGRIHLSVH
jgi:hypothetical protein